MPTSKRSRKRWHWCSCRWWWVVGGWWCGGAKFVYFVCLQSLKQWAKSGCAPENAPPALTARMKHFFCQIDEMSARTAREMAGYMSSAFLRAAHEAFTLCDKDSSREQILDIIMTQSDGERLLKEEATPDDLEGCDMDELLDRFSETQAAIRRQVERNNNRPLGKEGMNAVARTIRIAQTGHLRPTAALLTEAFLFHCDVLWSRVSSLQCIETAQLQLSTLQSASEAAAVDKWLVSCGWYVRGSALEATDLFIDTLKSGNTGTSFRPSTAPMATGQSITKLARTAPRVVLELWGQIFALEAKAGKRSEV